MEFFGLTITRTKAAVTAMNPTNSSSLVPSGGGWWPLLRESYAGAWQQNVEVRLENVLTYAAVYACVTLIASDIAKLRIRLVRQDGDDIWQETDSPAFSPVLRKPNHFQTRIEMIQHWLISKLIHGNTYVLKQRDERGVVTDLYVLHPACVTVLVAPNGEVFYELKRDDLSQQPRPAVAVPASEIIHDKYAPLYHPLVGISPISACGLAAIQGIRIQENSTNFFANGSNPGGVLTAPGVISDATAKRLKEYWDANYSGQNVGKVAVLGDGLKYEKMVVTAVDAQLIDQLKWTAENVCTAFHVPPYMIGVGPAPTYNNIEALNAQYYAQCLQILIESIEALLDDGLGLGQTGETKRLGTEFDLDALLRMDTATRVKAAAESVGSGNVSPNEARKRWFGLGPVQGGGTPYLQQQNYSLAALDKRDSSADPFGTTPAPAPSAQQALEPAEDTDVERDLPDLLRKALAA